MNWLLTPKKQLRCKIYLVVSVAMQACYLFFLFFLFFFFFWFLQIQTTIAECNLKESGIMFDKLIEYIVQFFEQDFATWVETERDNDISENYFKFQIDENTIKLVPKYGDKKFLQWLNNKISKEGGIEFDELHNNVKSKARLTEEQAKKKKQARKRACKIYSYKYARCLDFIFSICIPFNNEEDHATRISNLAQTIARIQNWNYKGKQKMYSVCIQSLFVLFLVLL